MLTFISTGTAYNKQGNYFLSTLESVTRGRSDSYTGTIASTPFVLTAPEASLLVGGGGNSDLYFSIHLANGTELYRTNRGENSEPLEPKTVNLSAYVDQSIYWQVTDMSTDSWGYIAVDDILFNQN